MEKMFVYIRKNEISNNFLREILREMVEKKVRLEKEFGLGYLGRYIKVMQKNRDTDKNYEFYYDRRVGVLYPIFENHKFKKLTAEKINQSEDIEKLLFDAFPYEYRDRNMFGLMTREHYRKSFFEEYYKNIVNKGIIKSKEDNMDSFAVIYGGNLKFIDTRMNEVEEGYVIPKKDIDLKGKDSQYYLEVFERELKLFKENGIEPIFLKKREREKYQELVEICDLLHRYGVEDGIIENFNRDEILKDMEKGLYPYSIDEYKKKLLNIEKIRIDTDPYDKDIFINSKRGHWDLFYDAKKPVSQREVVKVKTDEMLLERDPQLDMKEGGVVAIDFGTKSTVVAIQEKNDTKSLVRIGGGSYRADLKDNQYENPTVMEFVDIENFMKDYRGFSGRPFTKWQDLKISYTAVSDFLSGPESIIDGLKQWCGDENGFVIHDKAGKKLKLKPYLEVTDEDIDPIELYAYYIGSYINNMHTGNIFTNYILSYSLTYDQNIRDKMLRSFERGIKKSLPVGLLDNNKTMDRFSIINGASEPTAYFLCAMEEYGLFKEQGKESFYGIFDFGGGTSDFSFGTVKNISEPRYDYEVKCFGENGDKYLGGENILNAISYEVFKDNRDMMAAEGISFYCPVGCEKFNGYENLVIDSFNSKYNMRQMSNALRDLWEESDIDKYKSGKLKVTCMGAENKSLELQVGIDSKKLREIIRKYIEKGVQNFLEYLKRALENECLKIEVDKVDLFLAGNSSKHSYVREIFDEKIVEFKNKYKEESKKELEFMLYPPLGTEESRELQKKMGKSVTKEIITGKTGVAYGLIDVRKGGKIHVISEDELRNGKKDKFPYYVGYSINDKLEVILDGKTKVRQWVKFMKADSKKKEIYYSDSPVAAENMGTDDPTVRRKTIEIKEVDNGAYIYIRWVKEKGIIEYVVAYEDEIIDFDYLEGPEKIRL